MTSSTKSEISSAEGLPFTDTPLFLLGVVGSLLAVTSVFAKLAPELGWHPLGLLQWSVGGGALLLFAGSRRGGPGEGRASASSGRKRRVALFMCVSGLLFVVPNMIASVSAPRVGAGFVSLGYAFPLVLTYAIAVVIGLERFHPVKAIGTLCGVLGGILLAISGVSLLDAATLWAFLPLAIPVLLANGNIYRTLKWPEGMRPVDLATGMLGVGFAALAMFNLVAGVPMMPQVWSPENTFLLAAQTAIFGVQFALYFRLQKAAGPVYLSQIGSVAAITGLVLGYMVFAEGLDPAKLGAAIAAGLGILLVSRSR